MDRHAITQKIQGHAKRLRLLSKKVAARFSTDDIHAFRVEVKKLRALLRLVGSDEHKLPKGLRRIYRSVGDIRNLQLLRGRLQELVRRDHLLLPAAFFRHLDSRLIVATQEARNLLETGGGLKKLPRRGIAGLPARLTKARQAYFIHARIRRSHPGTTDVVEQLHELRKSLKDLLYAWPYLDNSARRLAATTFGRYAVIEENAGRLGDFLDVSIQLRLLADKTLFSENLTPHLLLDLRDRLLACQDRLLRQLDKTLHVRFQFQGMAGATCDLSPRQLIQITD